MRQMVFSISYSRFAVVATAIVSVAVIGALDFFTGYQISFAVFYLIPVGITSWFATRSWGLVLALGSSLVWYIAEVAAGYPYSHGAIPVWNAIVRLTFFVVTAFLLSELRRQLMSETHAARTDPLTGVRNARAFKERLEHDLALMDRFSQPLSLMYIDLDNFKNVNDKFGHHAGDRLLVHFSELLGESTRASDTVARLGGDEFAVILPGMNLESADSFVQKLVEMMSRTDAYSRGVTCSIGLVVFYEHPGSSAEAIKAADRLMYAVKAAGKNSHAIECYSGVKPMVGVRMDSQGAF